jgi:hypothetical protein
MSDKVTCECGKMIKSSYLPKHMLGKRCKAIREAKTTTEIKSIPIYNTQENNLQTEMQDVKNESHVRVELPRTYKERFNQHRAYYLIRNSQKYKEVIDESQLTLIKKYLKRSKKGVSRTTYGYARGSNSGRDFSKQISLQGLKKEVRHTLSISNDGTPISTDWDFVNAHPKCFSHILTEHKIEHPNLLHYINHRDEVLMQEVELNKKYNVSRSDIKKILLTIINGGEGDLNVLKRQSIFLQDYKMEIDRCGDSLKAIYPDEYEKALNKCNKLNETLPPYEHKKPIGKFINRMICITERLCLNALEEKLIIDEVIHSDQCVRVFDGLMTPYVSPHPTDNYLSECSKYIKARTGVDIQIAIKPLDSPLDIPPSIQPYMEYVPFDPHDPYRWIDFDREFRDVVFDSKADIIEHTQDKINKVLARVDEGTGLIIRKTDCDENLLDMCRLNESFTDLEFKYKHPTAKEVITKAIHFKNYLKENANRINRYAIKTFDPASNDPDAFQLWRGYKAQPIDGFNWDSPLIKELELILYHIKHIICNNDEESYNYFMSDLAFTLNRPGALNHITTFIYSSKHGVGKNIFLDYFVKKKVVGDRVYLNTTGLKEIASKHNDILLHKKIVVMDEMPHEAKQHKALADHLKAESASPTIVINPKGLKKFTIKNIIKRIMITNHKGIYLEPSDRRYLCLEASDIKKGDKDYFRKLSSCFTHKNGQIFMSLMKLWDESKNNFDHMPEPPLTPLKKKLIKKSSSAPLRFLMDLKEGEYDFRDMSERLTPLTKIKRKELYDHYKDWCDDTGERRFRKNLFYETIRDEADIPLVKVRGQMYYKINLEPNPNY